MNWVALRTRRDLMNSTQQHAQTMFINNNKNEVRFQSSLIGYKKVFAALVLG